MKKKLGLSAGAIMLSSAIAGGVAMADAPVFNVDNDTYKGAPYASWTDQHSVGGTWYDVFDKDPNRMVSTDFSQDSRIAKANPLGTSGAYYHWDIPTGSNTMYTYKAYVYLNNPYFNSISAEYVIDEGYSNRYDFSFSQNDAPLGWASHGTFQSYGTAHYKVQAVSPVSAGHQTYTGADGIGLTRM